MKGLAQSKQRGREIKDRVLSHSDTRPEKATVGREGRKAGRGQTEGGGGSQHGKSSHLTSQGQELWKRLRKRASHMDKDGQDRGRDI